MINDWKEVKVFVWGKTYPELSQTYYETVCTAGVLEDGTFVRLYPIPFRYLADSSVFSKYQWLQLRIKKASDDPRPESYKVDPASIKVLEKVNSDKFGWRARSSTIFKAENNIYKSAEALMELNERTEISMGFVRPHVIDDIKIQNRPQKDFDNFMQKLKANTERAKQASMFDLSIEDVKELNYISQRFIIHWKCNDPRCSGHKMSILDWEAYEMARKIGMNSTLSKLNEILDLRVHDVGFFLGNFRSHMRNFAIGSVWYPKRPKPTGALELF